MLPHCDNVYELISEVRRWRDHYHDWSLAPYATPEMQRAFVVLDEFAKRLGDLFGEPEEHIS